MEDFRGDFFVSISKGLLHKLGNVANGIGINIQACSSLDMSDDKFKNFLDRALDNNRHFSTMIQFMRSTLLNTISLITKDMWQSIQEYAVYNIDYRSREHFEVEWDTIDKTFFRILTPILLYHEGKQKSPIRICQTDSKLIMEYSESSPSEKWLKYLDSKNINYSFENNKLTIQDF